MVTSLTDELGMTLLGKTRGAILALLLDRPEEALHVRQIARLTCAGLGPVQRELKILARIGVLTRRESGSQVLYGVNLRCPIIEELRGLTVKTIGAAGELRKALMPLAKSICIAFVFGSLAKGQQRAASDIDVFVIGDASFSAVAGALSAVQRQLRREVNPCVYRHSEFVEKLRDGHHFVTTVTAGPKLFLIGDEHELSRLVEERLAPAAHDQSRGNQRTTRRRRTGLKGQRRRQSR